MIEDFTEEQVEQFDREGFLIIEEGFIDDDAVETLRERFDLLFAGDYQPGIKPDEVNWVAGRDPENVTRQICNGWKGDDTIAAQVLGERLGRLGATLMGWEGSRMLQDNCIWKPPGAGTLGMHQDASYADYFDPSEMITVWVALDETQAGSGTIEYVGGSHKWPRVPADRASFHDPEDWLAPARDAAPEGASTDRTPVVVKPGGVAFHHGLCFHGSGRNEATVERRAVISHLMPASARFDPDHVDLTYSRYRRRGNMEMDESFFPVLWTQDGGRSEWLAQLDGVFA
ncbi:MAG: phytanoyl-CoA dioxygenase family protein [Solirubrobacterales bacterium]